VDEYLILVYFERKVRSLDRKVESLCLPSRILDGGENTCSAVSCLLVVPKGSHDIFLAWQDKEIPDILSFPFPSWELKMFDIEVMGLAEAAGFAIGSGESKQ
jgi:hypothetical protein